MEALNKRHTKFFYLFTVALACLANFLLLVLIYSNIRDLRASLSNNKISGSIVTSEEEELFVKKLCEDLGINNEINIIVGPSYVPSFFSPLQNYYLNHLLTQYPVIVDPLDPTGRIFMGELIYKELDAEQKKGLIAHEMWHVYTKIKGVVKPGIQGAIEADMFVIQYVNPDVLINLYLKSCKNDPEIQILIANLKKHFLVKNPLAPDEKYQ